MAQGLQILADRLVRLDVVPKIGISLSLYYYDLEDMAMHVTTGDHVWATHAARLEKA